MMKTLEGRLLARTEKGDECWDCNYSLAKGYPQIWVDGKRELAHRVAYRLWVGEIPPRLFVCHSCDKPRCVNPAHLWVGTNQENVTDMMEKGRAAKGEKHCQAKLTELDVRFIRMWAAEGFNQQKIANAFSISQPHVSAIVRRKLWKHVL